MAATYYHGAPRWDGRALDDGGEVLVTTDEHDDRDVRMDHCEFDHPVSVYPIPVAYIQRLETTQ